MDLSGSDTDEDSSSDESLKQKVSLSELEQRNNIKYFELENKIKVYLIHNKKIKKSYVALDIKTGSLYEENVILGLAHFYGHVVTRGDPKDELLENNLANYVAKHGGKFDAHIYSDHSTFSFDLICPKLFEALNKFTKFFKGGICSDDSSEIVQDRIEDIKKDKKIIELKFAFEMQKNNQRIKEVIRYSLLFEDNLGKLYEEMHCTNICATLKFDINALIKYHNAYRSGNVMSLCILHSGKLEELEAEVTNYFKDIPNENTVTKEYCTFNMSPFYKPCKWIIKSLENTNILTIMFPLKDLRKDIFSRPAYYICFLLRLRSQGSFILGLIRRGWGYKIDCIEEQIEGEDSRVFNALSIKIELSTEGTANMDEVVKLLFEYLEMVKEKGPQKRFYWKYKLREDDETAPYNYLGNFERDKLLQYVKSRAKVLNKYPPENLEDLPEDLTEYYKKVEKVIDEWNSPLIMEILNDYLTPKKIRIYISTQYFKNLHYQELPITIYTTYAKIQYYCEEINNTIIEKWEEVKVREDKEFFLPPN